MLTIQNLMERWYRCYSVCHKSIDAAAKRDAKRVDSR